MNGILKEKITDTKVRINMYKYIKASVQDIIDDVVEEVIVNVEDSIDNEDFTTYDDVISEVYAQIQSLSDDIAGWTEADEDRAFDEVMAQLEEDGYINESAGTVTPQ